MTTYRIPDELVAMLSDRRVIPFVGAGFSAGHRLPGWTDLLKQVANDLRVGDEPPALSYAEIENACGGDFLQIAEYLYLRAGRSMGPLRHSMTKALQSNTAYDASTSHVELVNLGAPQVYTTNFDDLIEETYRSLGLPVQVIVLPRDVATADPNETQVVKYHGDLRHDETLVITESAYYERLEFSSPMDLKFRSDLLGRSVLFMGYSFRDINIRVIWFRLMEMMRDVPEAERPTSYMVMFEPNPVREKLYGAVGLRSIILDPDREATTPKKRTELLSRFLLDLASRASPSGVIPGRKDKMFASVGLLSLADERVAQRRGAIPRTLVPQMPSANPLLVLTRRQVLPGTQARVEKLILEAARKGRIAGSGARLMLWYASTYGPAPGVTLMAATSLMREVDRELLFSAPVDWDVVWESALAIEDASVVLRRVASEAIGHESRSFLDEDLAYGVDLLARIANGSLQVAGKKESVEQVRNQAVELLARIGNTYPVVAEYAPEPGKPDPRAVLDAIEARGGTEEADGDAMFDFEADDT